MSLKKVCFCLGLICLCVASPAAAQESLITRALQSNASIVSVRSRAPGHLEKRGAGVILSPDGIIVTNLHTIFKANIVLVMLSDHREISAKIVRLMPEADLALLKVPAPYPLKPIAFADSRTIRLGEPVLQIGHSYILNKTISEGRITGVGTRKDTGDLSLLQVDFSLYPGDSGGPLLNTAGELIGMITAKNRLKHRTAYAVPANKIKKLYSNFKN